MKGGHKVFEYRGKVSNVVDGDTLDVEVDLGFKIATKQRIRLAHVDTPERSEQKYAEAKKLVEDLTLNKNVFLRTSKPSKWGYYLAEVITETGQDIAQVLISQNLCQKYEGGKK